MAVSKNTIKVVIDISKGIAVQAKGHPANVVSYGTAAAVVLIAGVVGAGAYEGGKALFGGVKHLLEKKNSPSRV
jgi:hypothetical protein